MENLWDEVAKSLAESVPRRETLRRLGGLFAGALLAPLGLQTAWGRGPAAFDPCKDFCRSCHSKAQQSQCLTACHACNGMTSCLRGTCGGFACCSTGLACCSGVCTDFSDDRNCGRCGNDCASNGLTCCKGVCKDRAHDVNNCGACGHACRTGELCCRGVCTSDFSADPNCGGCGNDCGAQGLICCDGVCADLAGDVRNCGACGIVCAAPTPYCNLGVCSENADCPGGGTRCNGICTNLNFDTLNCGACGVRCGDGETCSGGVCQSPF